MATFDEEKHQYAVNDQGSPGYDHGDHRKGSITGLKEGGVAVGEAAALYGDVETAESKSQRPVLQSAMLMPKQSTDTLRAASNLATSSSLRLAGQSVLVSSW